MGDITLKPIAPRPAPIRVALAGRQQRPLGAAIDRPA